jgi:hypothetical protein
MNVVTQKMLMRTLLDMSVPSTPRRVEKHPQKCIERVVGSASEENSGTGMYNQMPSSVS